MKFVRLLILVSLCLFPAMLRAQSCGSGYTQVTGTYSPYANGSVSAGFINQSSLPQLPLLNGSVFAQFNNTNFDSSGVMGFCLADNNQINPTPSQWKITACQHGGGGPGCCTETVTVTGSTEDISTFLNTCPFIAPPAVDPTAVHKNTTSPQAMQGSLSAPTLSANCSQVLATGDTRCNTGADFSVRSNNCLGTNVPTNHICDASSEVAPVVSQTINVPGGFDLRLPPTTITCNVAPCIEANGTTGFTILGASSAAEQRTIIHMTVHGPAVLLNGQTYYGDIGQFLCDYSAIDGSAPSTHPEDKCVVISGGTGVSPRELNIHDIVSNYGYDTLFDGDCAAGTGSGQCNAFTFSGTNSNVVTVRRVEGWRIGNAAVSFGAGSGVHDQMNLDMVGCDGTRDASGIGCIYVGTANNLTIGTAWAWHINDSSAGTGGAPANWWGIAIQTVSTCTIGTMDFEANYMLGNSWMFANLNSHCDVSNISSYFNTFGGSGGAGANQAYIRNDLQLTLATVLINNTNSDVCSATGATADAFYEGTNTAYFKFGRPLSTLPTMPSGTNCSPIAVNGWGNIDESNAYLYSTAQNIYSMFEGDLTVKSNHNYPQTLDYTNMYGTSSPIQFDPNGGLAPMLTPGFTVAAGDIPRFNTPDGHLQSTGYNATNPIPSNFVQGTVQNLGVTWTPAAATVSQCVEQTVTVTGIKTGAGVTANPPNATGAHVWIGWVRVTAANTVGVGFCSDATGGTPPSGTWYFRQ